MHTDLYHSFLIYRFDIYGLSPDADEDEAGIKRASENSTSIKRMFTVHMLGMGSFSVSAL